jgi:hypothetical protein
VRPSGTFLPINLNEGIVVRAHKDSMLESTPINRNKLRDLFSDLELASIGHFILICLGDTNLSRTKKGHYQTTLKRSQNLTLAGVVEEQPGKKQRFVVNSSLTDLDFVKKQIPVFERIIRSFVSQKGGGLREKENFYTLQKVFKKYEDLFSGSVINFLHSINIDNMENIHSPLGFLYRELEKAVKEKLELKKQRQIARWQILEAHKNYINKPKKEESITAISKTKEEAEAWIRECEENGINIELITHHKKGSLKWAFAILRHKQQTIKT